MPGLEAVIAEAKVALPKNVKRVVLVGNKISPGQPSKKDDGTVVRTVDPDATEKGGPSSRRIA